MIEKIEGLIGAFNIGSKSEQINSLFSSDVKSRNTFDWLEKQKFKFSNSELLEIISIAEYLRVKKNVSSSSLFTNLVINQKGPFNGEVFDKFSDLVGLGSTGFNKTESLIELIKKSENLSTDQKVNWLELKNTLVRSFTTVFFDFFENGLAEKCGILANKKPYNSVIATQLMLFGYSSFDENNDVKKFFWGILDSLTESDFNYWFQYSVMPDYSVDIQVKIISDYQNSSEKILKICFDLVSELPNKTMENEFKIVLAMHKNFPEDMKMKLFAETLDMRIAPKDVTDFFF